VEDTGGFDIHVPAILVCIGQVEIWEFPKMGVPQKRMVYNGQSIYRWMIWGYPYFRKSPYQSVGIHVSFRLFLRLYTDSHRHFSLRTYLDDTLILCESPILPSVNLAVCY
jgi:hypothetical protein